MGLCLPFLLAKRYSLLDLNLVYGEEIDNYKRLLDLPFDSERKLMTTVIKVDGKYVAITKGAPDRVINLSTDEQAEKDAASWDAASFLQKSVEKIKIMRYNKSDCMLEKCVYAFL